MTRVAWALADDGLSARGYHRGSLLPVAEVRYVPPSDYGAAMWAASEGGRSVHGTFVTRAQAQRGVEVVLTERERTRRARRR